MSIGERMYPSDGSVSVLSKHCSDARFVWNVGLEQRNYWRRGIRRSISVYDQKKSLTEARAAYDWLAEGSSSVQQQALFVLDRAFKNWWKRTHARPTWRKAGVNESFYVRDLAVRRITRAWAEVLIPKAGYVRFRLTRAWADIEAASSARVSLDRAGRWWVSFRTPPPVFERRSTGAVVGLDRGVANSVATSDGTMLHAPGLTAGEQTRFLALARQLARQQKGYHRRAATRIKLARLHARLGDRRKEWIEQTSTVLVRDYDLIAIEDLRITNMTKRPKPRPDENRPGAFLPNGARAKAALNRAILASCWGGLEARLTHKTSFSDPDHPSALVNVNPRNTSRTCTECGHVSADNRESQAVLACTACGHQAHADTNAAINIRERALNPVLAAIEVCGRTDRERTQKSPHKPSSVNRTRAA
jgi:putative transposase